MTRNRWSRTVAWIWIAAAIGVSSLTCRRADPPPRFRVIERLADHIERDPQVFLPERDATRAAARHRWTTEQIASQWTRTTGPAGTTFRSPAIDVGTIDDLEAIVVTMRAGTVPAILLWSDGPEVTGGDLARNRRALEPRRDRVTTVAIPARAIRGESATMLRHLFLSLPNGSQPIAVIDSIALVTVLEALDTSTAGRARVTIDDDVRDAVYGDGDRLSFRVDLTAGAELHVGMSALPADARIQGRVTTTIGDRTTTLFSGEVSGGRWRDVRLALPASNGVVVQLSSDNEARGVTLLWSNPVIVSPASGPTPNVVLYVVDSLRADRLGAYGARTGRSPFLDDLARRSRVFERAYAAASWTKPSVATLLTGLWPLTHRLGARYYTDSMPASVPTLQSRLQARGYVTAQFSANPFTGTVSNLDRGFDRTLVPSAFAASTAPGSKIPAGALNDRIFPWLDAHARDAFFLYVQSIEPHEPRAATPPGVDPGIAYDNEVAASDREIQRLYDRLASVGLLDRTLLIVTSDHGEALGERGQWGHGLSVHEEEVRVPLIVHWPGAVRPGTVAEPVSLIDVVPTILEYCNVRFDRAELQGRSLVPESRAGWVERPVLTTRFVYPDDPDQSGAARPDARALIDFPWKLIATDMSTGQPPRLELFNLIEDPLERRDRASTEGGHAERLHRALMEFLAAQTVARAEFLATHAGGVDDPTPRPPSPKLLELFRSLGYVK